ncbi:MAG: signal peptidase I [Coprobacillus cateniformis]|uniref:Signal peptidase I n=1 Tax=Longibaculum muris TaxID=1796628 RepID=A0A4V2W5P0_9FIRM|nr:signal peptidase I [Longibaculum muris]KXU47029.1 signal peptidase I [Candidatus Stoquefichus sp. KLE1796]MBS5113461.1 signal peptidase I [Coprobacillus cateniformis]MBS5369534.1 signal peptidase I [Coprobacillus cateniformis]MCR1888345.1 signal peptidase I [Longibaculum muris]MED9812806.1 signal peptidase I [Longibaculum muris]
MMKKVCNILSGIVFIILLALAILMFVPNFIGYKGFAVISGSMEPKIPVGSIVYAKEAAFSDLEVGDVISYKINNDTMVTHRIYSIDEKKQTVVTKGDANEKVDTAEVKSNQIVGKVAMSIPLIGYITIYAKTPIGIIAICAIAAILILLNFLPDIFEKENKKEEETK